MESEQSRKCDMIKKMDGGYGVIHCHGSDKGKFINKKPMTKKKALKMHQAIQLSKLRLNP